MRRRPSFARANTMRPPVAGCRGRVGGSGLALSLVAGLTACSATDGPSHDPWHVEAMAAVAPLSAPAHEQALFIGLVERAAVERAEGDWAATRHALDLARLLLAGKDAEPTPLEARSLTDDWRDALTPARDSLVSARLGGARTLAPLALARAQVAFECWFQEAEENRIALQGQHLFDCRDTFEAAMADVDEAMGSDAAVLLLNEDGSVGAAVLNPTAQGARSVSLDAAGEGAAVLESGEIVRLVVFRPEDTRTLFGNALDAQAIPPARFSLPNFPLGSTRLPPGSDTVLRDILADAERRAAYDLVIVGHADTVGANRVNDRLGLRRAAAVRDWLLGAGLTPERVMLETSGETRLAVPTPDEQAEELNRRVVVTIR